MLPNLVLHRDYHQKLKQANHSEHRIQWRIFMDNLTAMRWRTPLHMDLQKVELMGYRRSSGTCIGRVTVLQLVSGNACNT